MAEKLLTYDLDHAMDDGDSITAEKIRQERLGIVNRYAKGPSLDDEEDDDMKIYNVIDQYGFLHKSEPVPLPKQEEDRRRENEVKRRTKWLKMVKNWYKYVGTEKLSKRVYKGIPQGMRSDVWRMLLQVHQYMATMPDVYQEMKTRAHSHSDDIRQIDLDVNRTYRDHIMFKTRYCIKQQELFHVLAAYSMYNTEVGYCQGMSQIAALLLMYMNEEEAFWALHSLLYGEKHRMHGFFIPGFPKLMRFQSHHDRILKKLTPKLKKHLDENEVFASLYTMKWFFQCFLDRSPFSLTLRLWDIYILEGEKLLTAMSYATLKMHKAHIKTQDMDGIVAFLQEELVKDFRASDDTVVEYLKACMVELKKMNLDHPPNETDEEKPKIEFGTQINTDKKSHGMKYIPEFAKHSIDIRMMPEVKRKNSQKKNRDKVKRGKSNAGKTALAVNGGNRVENSDIKGGKSLRDPQAVSRSPFLRGSMKKQAKTMRITDQKKNGNDTGLENEKKLNETDKKKKKKSENVVQSKGKEQKTRANEQRKENDEQRDTGKRPGKDETYMVGHVTNENNKKDSRPNENSHLDTHTNSKNTSAHKDADEHLKTFIPPLLSNKLSSSGAESHASANESSHSPHPSSPSHKVAIKWRTPSSERKSPHVGDASMARKKRNSKPRYDDYDGGSVFDADSNGTKSPVNVKAMQRGLHLRSQSSDVLQSVTEYELSAKTPSFSQLTAKLDSLENVHFRFSESVSPTDSGSRTTSPKQASSNERPQSFYDNVPYPYYPSTYVDETIPAIPGSPNTSENFSEFDRELEVSAYVASV